MVSCICDDPGKSEIMGWFERVGKDEENEFLV